MSPDYIALLDMASDINVWVDVDDVGWLEDGAAGGWFPEHDLILLAPGLHPVEQRCTLAHELGHATHGHHAGTSGWLHARQERQADQFAATLLIPQNCNAVGQPPISYRCSLSLPDWGYTL